MASEQAEDTPVPSAVDDEDGSSDSGSESGNEGGEQKLEPEIEWLATSRQKRSTAGNRLNSLLQQEESDDELELLFAEPDDDEVFDDVEADSDVQMDSSSDDDDQGPTAGADDLEGEKELQKKEKAEQRAKRRKVNDGIPKVFRKKVKIDPAESEAHNPAPRPKKKSERASWIPTPEDAPTRASARGTTKQSKQQLHQQMVEREIKRLKQLESMEKAAAQKKAREKPPLTQEDRLKEAAKVEKRNAKSLNKWEEAEQQRQEEQRLRLEALHNRKLNGPVITTWNAKGEWVGGVLKKAGRISVTIVEPKEKVSKKRKLADMEEAEAAKTITVLTNPPSIAESRGGSAPSPPTNGQTQEKDIIDPQLSAIPVSKPPSTSPVPVDTTHIQSSSVLAPPRPPSLSSTLEPPPRTSSVLAPPPMHGPYPPPPIHGAPRPSSVLAPPPMHGPIPLYPAPQLTPASHPPFKLAPPIQPQFDGSSHLPGFGYNFMSPPTQFLGQPRHHPAIIPQQPTQQPTLPPPSPQNTTPPPPAIEHAALTYLILSNFHPEKIKDPEVQLQILFHGQKFAKLPPSKTTNGITPIFLKKDKEAKKNIELCAITGYPARYRDPVTGLAFCNKEAYRRIEGLKRGEFGWSSLVGGYVGVGGVAARGVPSRFLDGKAKGPGATGKVQSGIAPNIGVSVTPGTGTAVNTLAR